MGLIPHQQSFGVCDPFNLLSYDRKIGKIWTTLSKINHSDAVHLCNPAMPIPVKYVSTIYNSGVEVRGRYLYGDSHHL